MIASGLNRSDDLTTAPWLQLDGVIGKIKRAGTELDLLRRQIEDFCTRQEDLFTKEVDTQSNQQLWKFSAETPVVPVDWALSVGSIAYQLRSSLDHLLIQLVLNDGGNPTPANQFPICGTKKEFEKDHSQQQMQGLQEATKTRIRTLQPYQEHGLIGFRLPLLRHLSNVDRHRYPNILAVGVGDINLELDEWVAPTKPPVSARGFLRPLAYGNVFLEITPADAPCEPTFEVSVRFADNEATAYGRLNDLPANARDYALSELNWAGAGKEVLLTMDGLLTEVKDIMGSLTRP